MAIPTGRVPAVAVGSARSTAVGSARAGPDRSRAGTWTRSRKKIGRGLTPGARSRNLAFVRRRSLVLGSSLKHEDHLFICLMTMLHFWRSLKKTRVDSWRHGSGSLGFGPFVRRRSGGLPPGRSSPTLASRPDGEPAWRLGASRSVEGQIKPAACPGYDRWRERGRRVSWRSCAPRSPGPAVGFLAASSPVAGLMGG